METATLNSIFADVAKLGDGRWFPKEPYSFRGFTFATDGVIIVRVRGEIAPPKEFGRDPTELPWDRSNYVAESTPLRETLPKIARISCNECGGTGKARRKCAECGGTGKKECHECGHKTDCEECDGYGFIVASTGDQCASCGGSGKVADPKQVVTFGKARIARRYVEILKKHGVREIFRHVGGVNRPWYFEIGDTQGLVMPLAT